MSTPDVSFIISIYKPDLTFLREMVESVVRCCRAASGIKCEVILSSDGSPDDAAKYVDEFAAKYPDLIVGANSPVNRGIGNARCFLVEKSRGRYVASFDQDDIMLPFDLAGAVKFLDENKQYAASYAPKCLFTRNGLTGKSHGGSISRFNEFFTPKININAMLIRREELLAHQSFMPCPGSPINDDVYLMFRLQYDRDIYFDRNPRCLYRCHDKQNRFLDKQDDFVVMGKAMINRAPELYQEIIDGDIPEETPENFRAIQGFFGLAFYFNQTSDRELAYRIVKTAVSLHPEDPGTWEALLVVSFANGDFESVFHDACRHFENDVEALLVFYSWMVIFYQKRRAPIPQDILNKQRQLDKEFFAIPDIVRENLPPSVKMRPNYSFVAPKFKL